MSVRTGVQRTSACVVSELQMCISPLPFPVEHPQPILFASGGELAELRKVTADYESPRFSLAFGKMVAQGRTSAHGCHEALLVIGGALSFCVVQLTSSSPCERRIRRSSGGKYRAVTDYADQFSSHINSRR